MSKWIDIDDISLLKTVSAGGLSAKALWKRIRQEPSIDLVRCGECKHNYNTAINHGKMNPRCDFMDAKLKADDFCSYGERRTDDR